LTTQSSNKIEDNIASVFGINFFSTLTKIEFNPVSETFKGNEVDHNSDPSFSYQGFVSKVREGVGRSDNDRQYIFCNGRPVDIPSIPKLFNEVLFATPTAFHSFPGSSDVEKVRDEPKTCFHHQHSRTTWLF
jgi:DNA mismatch repair protein PMS2